MKKILVWLSWGVDSAVSALLLREQGYEVACGYMINYLDEDNPTCPTRIDMEEARSVAEFLGLPFYTFDYREEYEGRIVDYIYREYEIWHTPNPDVFCNNLVKFDLFLEEALSLGFDAIAMGHYARIDKSEKIKVKSGKWYQRNSEPSGEMHEFWNSYFPLLKGLDPLKDQSYFLSRLSPFQLAHALFPIWDLLKSEVREIAKKAGLPNAERKDSQGLCFIGKVSMKEFLEKRFPKKPWNILDTHGKILGTHEWAYSYTLWQRKWIAVGGGPALFVVAKDTHANTITVGNEHDLALFSSSCTLTDWVGDTPIEWKVYGSKIRYRQEDQECRLKLENGNWKVGFKNPQRAIASGQICVIYDGDRVVGSWVMI